MTVADHLTLNELWQRARKILSRCMCNTFVCYDIPWNPTRLIQRLGRVNRVGSPFKEVFVYHFFPTEKGASVADPKAVAQNKLHLIHRALGEDAKILSPEEEPAPSRIYERLLRLPEEEKGESFEAWARREWERLTSLAPGLEERVRKLPDRVKTGVRGEKWEALVVARKGLAFFGLAKGEGEKGERAPFLPEVFDRFRDVTPETPRLELSHEFYKAYENLVASLESKGGSAPPSPNSIEVRALFKHAGLDQEAKGFPRHLPKGGGGEELAVGQVEPREEALPVRAGVEDH